ncbi:PIG-L deacetylase family protein [Parafilimonas terrae]|uniref:N-acetylglucosaminyl deacetylase, LmbE family n=1 Tax=Parafilimonas terrae TaxID=1465490 RepID=A0A1I5Y0V4_9BACT|nr:PIG-L deacetylase family protein [Parafilimonas terrae]SFQ37815.1 N-acetylglucosaminyl deacetylase, LmbE family [Parafilimonas terrae]
MNILCIVAHPDDTEILCAGTLIRYIQAGHAVTIAIFTDGSMGDAVIEPAVLKNIRAKEARAAADLIGANLVWGDVIDEHVFPDAAQRIKMIDILRKADPDIIFTHSPNDYHPDHRYVSQLVFDAYFQKGLPHIPNQQMPACRFGKARVYYMDNLGGIGFSPAEYVDISDVFELKKQMLACHKSQFEAMKDLADTNLFDMIEVQARFRGMAAGCRYAEAFTRLDAFQRGLTSRILP